jgi:acetylornithine/N-succinyldiaminopimelate aminotransferase
MKEIVPTPPPIVRNQFEKIRELFTRNVVPSYGRFDLALSHGSGSYLFDVNGRRCLDLGGGIAVCALGHAHPAITEALVEQSKKLVHISNLYYHEPQGRLAQALVELLGPGKCFFCNSGAEANEGLFKLARKFGHDQLVPWPDARGHRGHRTGQGEERLRTHGGGLPACAVQ